MLNTPKALQLLKFEAQNYPDEINERVLRVMHDVGVAGVEVFYPSKLAEDIGNNTEVLITKYQIVDAYVYWGWILVKEIPSTILQNVELIA